MEDIGKEKAPRMLNATGVGRSQLVLFCVNLWRWKSFRAACQSSVLGEGLQVLLGQALSEWLREEVKAGCRRGGTMHPALTSNLCPFLNALPYCKYREIRTKFEYEFR